jgi:dTDP-4-dehydrorhamnose reductase
VKGPEPVLLVTGAAGMLGRAVVGAAQDLGLTTYGLARAELDVTDPAGVRATLEALRPTAVVNCAAWTDVDGAESQPEQASAINGVGAGNLARAASAIDAFLVQVSTDYVFAGDSPRPYVESDPPAPRSAYGASKLAGERAVLEADARHAVVRTAWLFGVGGRNFVDTMLDLAAAGREEVSVVTDQVGCPTWTGHLAQALLEVLRRRSGGVHHACGAGQCSWNELAREVFARAGLAMRVLPASSAEMRRPAPRPPFSVLGSERPDPIRLPPWQEGVSAHLRARGIVPGVVAADRTMTSGIGHSL